MIRKNICLILISILLSASLAVASNSGSSSIHSIFKEKSVTCQEKYQKLIKHTYKVSSIIVPIGQTITWTGGIGASAALLSTLGGYAILAGMGPGVVSVLIVAAAGRWHEKRVERSIQERVELLNETAGVEAGHASGVSILQKIYESKADYFSQYVPSYEGISWTIEEAVETGRACEKGRPWNLSEFRNYAMIRVKQKYEEVLNGAKAAELLPEQ